MLPHNVVIDIMKMGNLLKKVLFPKHYIQPFEHTITTPSAHTRTSAWGQLLHGEAVCCQDNDFSQIV